MSRSRTPSASPETPPANPRGVGINGPAVLAGIATSLLLTRCFVPAESAAQGDTLWITSLWLLLGAVAPFFPRSTAAVRPDRLDSALMLWIGFQVLSALVLVHGATGERRLAMNLLWEWLAIAVSWFVFRYRVPGSAQRILVPALLTTGIVLAGYGIFQNRVEHPRLVARYGPLFDRLHAATGTEAAALRQQLGREGIPTEGPAQVLFEKRFRDSQEPIGLFALANTFGGLLAVCLVLVIAQAFRSERSFRQTARWAAAAGVIAFCLLLTKSRTAWVGTTVGIVGIVLQERAAVLRSVLVKTAGLVLLSVLVLTPILLSLGALDQQVLTEAPKSLAYRIQYWQATGRLIADYPLLGVAPGNFRQHYLRYKLPEASEEIADPHNLILETAATGGLVSAAALMAFLALTLFRLPRIATEEIPADARSVDPAWWIVLATGGGAFIAFAGLLMTAGIWEDRLLILGVIWPCVAWAFRPARPGDARAPAWAGLLALIVHLLGAGGIGMPGIAQLIVVLAAVCQPALPSTLAVQRRCTTRNLAVSALALLLLAGLSWDGGRAVAARRSLEAGIQTGWSPDPSNMDPTRAAFERATEQDPWSAEPWRLLAEWTLPRIPANESWQTGVDLLKEVLARDPVNSWTPRMLSLLAMREWETTRKPQAATEAVTWARQATQRYPTSSQLAAELAIALEAAGDAAGAVAAAQRALQQDDLTKHYGHVDRYLPPALRQRMQGLAEDPSRTPSTP